MNFWIILSMACETPYNLPPLKLSTLNSIHWTRSTLNSSYVEVVIQICLSFIFCTCWSPSFLTLHSQNQTTSHELGKFSRHDIINTLRKPVCLSQQTAACSFFMFPEPLLYVSIVAQLSRVL